MAKVAVLGAGSWGTALAKGMAEHGHEVWLWARNPETASRLASDRENRAYLAGIRLPDALRVTDDLATALYGAGIWFIFAETIPLPWCFALGYVGQRLGLELLDAHSPLKSFMHRFDAVIGAGLIAAAAYFVWSRFKVYKQYKLEAAVEVSKAD